MKPSYLTILLLISAAILMSACNTPQNKNIKPVITVSIGPQKYFIERLLDTLVEVNVMIPPGASHATYAPTPGQIVKLSHSTAYFLMGHLSFENTWKEKMESANENMKWFDLSHGIKPITGVNDHHPHGHECPQGIDPHTWTSPKEVETVITNSKNHLMELFPQHKTIINNNYKIFIKDIKQLDQRLTNLRETRPGMAFMIFHPAYTYLARAYGFEQITIEFEGKTPSPTRMQTTIEQALEKKVSTIYIQQEFDQANARAIAKAIDAKTIQVDPLSENWLMEMQRFITYLENE